MGTVDLKRSPFEIVGWAVLVLLLIATLIGAVRLNRAELPLLGDEATYAMQAASLAWDFDLTYNRQDYDRFVAHWGVAPKGLILQSRPGGDRLVYGKPPLYTLVTAPFVRVSPARGAVVANALMLAAAALLAARSLRGRIGAAAPLWVAAFVFASVAFAYVFWGDADLFLFASVAAGFSLVYLGDRRYARLDMPQVYQGEDTLPSKAVFYRWLGAGALLAVAVAYRPVYLVLFLPALLAARESAPGVRGRAAGGLILGAALLLSCSMGLQWLAGGDLTGYGGMRQGIYARKSFPEVDFPAADWNQRVEKKGNDSWLQREAVRPQPNPALLGWNVLYFFLGRNFGVLPYFLPLVLGFLAFQADRGRWLIPFAVGAAVLAFLLLRPFNFEGGGVLGNRYFLPLYPALWFLAARPARALWAPIVALLATPFLGLLWKDPTAYPLEGAFPRHISQTVQRWLPFETTQANAPGPQVSAGGGLWVKALSPNIWATGKGGGLSTVGGTEGEILVGSPQPLRALHFEFGARASSRLLVGGSELRPLLLRPDGGVLFEVPLGSERAVHRLWWGPYDYHLYAMRFRLPGAPTAPISLHILPSRDLIENDWEE